jgi:hypothetical protein
LPRVDDVLAGSLGEDVTDFPGGRVESHDHLALHLPKLLEVCGSVRWVRSDNVGREEAAGLKHLTDGTRHRFCDSQERANGSRAAGGAIEKFLV